MLVNPAAAKRKRKEDSETSLGNTANSGPLWVQQFETSAETRL